MPPPRPGPAAHYDAAAIDRLAIGRLVTDSRHIRSGGIVLLAGKGHEQYQTIRGVNHPFSDARVAQVALRERAQ